MPLGGDYDRADLFQRAERARKRGKKRQAIVGYRDLLAVDRGTPEVHARLAPLLARTGQRFDAWLSFRAAAEGFMQKGERDRALAIYYDAAHHLPKQPEIWQTLARLQCARGKTEEALRALEQGRQKLSRRRERAEAIFLLRAAHEIRPWHAATVLDLARLLWRTGQRRETLLLLEALSQRVRGRDLCRARGLQFRVSYQPLHGWLWLKSWKQRLRASGGGRSRSRTRATSAP